MLYDGGRPLGERVAGVTIGGERLEEKRVYSVACSEILARGAAGFTPLVAKAHIFATGSIHPRCDGRLIIEGALPRARPRT